MAHQEKVENQTNNKKIPHNLLKTLDLSKVFFILCTPDFVF
jgi:hypothetical protein